MSEFKVDPDWARAASDAIACGMKSGELPNLRCPACAEPIAYDVFREDGRIVSLAIRCPCGVSRGGLHGL